MLYATELKSLRGLLFAVVLLVTADLARAAEEPKLSSFQEARRLEQAGREEEAFSMYLSVPGAEHAAARLARSKAKDFLGMLRGKAQDVATPRSKLVEGDLLLTLGRKAEALACFRQVVGKISKRQGDGWHRGLMPPDYYPVEPPERMGSGRRCEPFAAGPGSHRDNWLIRRFIALEAWDEVAGEFARIWGIHRRLAKPYVAIVPRHDPKTMEATQERRIFQPVGFNGRGLQFAIDYAYFLTRRDQVGQALAVLMEALLDIDMDRNPNNLRPGDLVPEGEAAEYPERSGPLAAGGSRFHRDAYAGISRKEFVRLTYGVFKDAGKGGDLVTSLQAEIRKGRNRARRVLARLRFHQGAIEKALALELAYIEADGFDALSSAYRRGLAYENSKRYTAAAAEYEEALGLPYVAPDLPDTDEEQMERLSMSATPRVFLVRGRLVSAPQGKPWFLCDTIGRLQRLYAALGRTDKVLELTLRQLDMDSSRIERFDAVEEALQKSRSLGKEKVFLEWAARRVKGLESPAAKANLYWSMGDHARAAEAVAAVTGPRNVMDWTMEQWKARFREAGEEKLRLLLRALVDARPDDALARLELLDLQGRFEGDELVRTFESLLESRPTYAFEQTRGEHKRTRFRNYFDLAYRLMRLYEREGRSDRLCALGLRIARGLEEKQIGRSQYYRYGRGNDVPEDLNACLSLAIQYADEATAGSLEEALAAWPQLPAMVQLARRKAGGLGSTVQKAFGWANLPGRVSALASNENVLSLAHDHRHIYAGTPWGVAVYTHRGEPVIRVALAAAPHDLLAHGDHLWVGTRLGVNRVTIGSWKVAYLDLRNRAAAPDDLTLALLARRDKTAAYDAGGPPVGCHALAGDGSFVWIGTRHGIQRLDTRANTLRVYSAEELGGRDVTWTRFLVDDKYVWVSSRDVSARYDRKSDTWARVSYDEKGVGLIAFADGVLWGQVQLNKELRNRPCIIDRDSLAAKPVLIDGKLPTGGRTVGGRRFIHCGTWQGKPVLRAGHWMFFYDPRTSRLRLLGDSRRGDAPRVNSDLLPGLCSRELWRKPDGTIVCFDGYVDEEHLPPGLAARMKRWAMTRLPDGTVVLAGRRTHCPSYGTEREGKYDAYELWNEGGLHLISPDWKTVRRISSTVAREVLPGDRVHGLVICRSGNDWVCTDRGLAALREDDQVLAHATRAEGLCANRVVAGAELAGRVYFATGWGDYGGGLAVYDPRTAVFTSRHRSDGLAAEKLMGLRVRNGKLTLTYDAVDLGYRNSRHNYRHDPPGELDPRSGVITASGGAERFSRSGMEKLRQGPSKDHGPMPYLGGIVLAVYEQADKKYLCGTRGLVILEQKGTPPPLAIEELEPRTIFDPSVALREAAEKVPISVTSRSRLAQYLEDENPFVRARAMAALRYRSRELGKFARLIATQCGHPNLRVRATALHLLTQIGDAARGSGWRRSGPPFRHTMRPSAAWPQSGPIGTSSERPRSPSLLIRAGASRCFVRATFLERSARSGPRRHRSSTARSPAKRIRKAGRRPLCDWLRATERTSRRI